MSAKSIKTVLAVVGTIAVLGLLVAVGYVFCVVWVWSDVTGNSIVSFFWR